MKLAKWVAKKSMFDDEDKMEAFLNKANAKSILKDPAFKISKAVWDKDNKTAVLTFDSTKTNEDAILKSIALAGYDNEKFIAPDNAYNKLDMCCQYERTGKKTAIITTSCFIKIPKVWC